MKFLIVALAVLVLQGCACNSCEEAEMPKHEFTIGEIVHHRLDVENKYIIQDTTRDGCEPEYLVEDKDGYSDYVLEINLKK
jgi:hypothetical protein